VDFCHQMTVLEKLAFDWEQVLKVWVVAAATLLAVIWALNKLPYLLPPIIGYRTRTDSCPPGKLPVLCRHFHLFPFFDEERNADLQARLQSG
jgi:hypothetical protein